jgi:hypothetical protein
LDERIEAATREGRTSDYYGEQELSQLFDEFIERWAQWQQSFKAWSDFHQKNQYPRQPEGVLNISSLAKYRREVSQYERNREIVDRRHRRHDAHYKDTTTRTRETPPKGSTIDVCEVLCGVLVIS